MGPFKGVLRRLSRGYYGDYTGVNRTPNNRVSVTNKPVVTVFEPQGKEGVCSWAKSTLRSTL